jgi:hypothetical protein
VTRGPSLSIGWVLATIVGIGLLATAAVALADPPATVSGPLSDAQRFPVDGAAMIEARAIADDYWDADPCHGHVAISWRSINPHISAISAWLNPRGAYADPADNGHCTVTFNPAQTFDWPMFCTVFVHEFGHLTGHQHVRDRNSVMYPVYTAPLPECANAPVPPSGDVLQGGDLLSAHTGLHLTARQRRLIRARMRAALRAHR